MIELIHRILWLAFLASLLAFLFGAPFHWFVVSFFLLGIWQVVRLFQTN